jgi:hypothetical protein
MFYIHEVYYNDNGSIYAMSENPVTPAGETIKELQGDMEYFLQAFDRPVLRMGEIVFAPKDENE